MLTKIEQLMFQGRNMTHGVVGWALTPDKLLLTVAQRGDLGSPLCAEFPEFKITSLELYPDEPDDLNLPWEFVLHCDSLE